MHTWTLRITRAAAPLFAYLIALAAVTGCERTPATARRGKLPSADDLIVLIGPPRSNPQWPGIQGGARRFIEQYPSLRLETAAPSDSNSAALLRIVDGKLSHNPRAVCLYVSDPAAARPSAKRIVKAGTILVTMGNRSDVAGVFGHVQVDLASGAELLGAHLLQIAHGKRSYLLVHNHRANPTQTHYYERFMQKARSQYGMTLLEEQNASEAQQPAAELLRAMFRRFRHAGLAVTLDPVPWLTTSPAELLGRDAKFATLTAVPMLWPWLRSGEAAAVAGPLDGDIGWLAVEMALVALTESRKPGLLRVVQCELVTPETLDDFAQRYAEAAGLDLNELLPPTAAPPKPLAQP